MHGAGDEGELRAAVWGDHAVLRSVEITAELTGPLQGEGFHNLHWQKKLELSLDCFICGRTRRTTFFQYGLEHALCSADDKHPEHPTAARITAFDITGERGRTALRAVVDYWWVSFHDTKRGQAATSLSFLPWGRLHLGYYCPQSRQPGVFGIQTNVVRPVRATCDHCDRLLAISKDAPAIRLLT